MTINDIQRIARQHGSHWFDPGTLRFFKCRIHSNVYEGPNGTFFVSSEAMGFSTDERGFSVRKFDQQTGEIDTVGQINDYKSRSGAHAAALRCAGDGATINGSVPHRPISELEQFVTDIRQHGGKCTKADAKRLIEAAKRHRALMVQFCNGRELFDSDGEPKKPLFRNRFRIGRLVRKCGLAGVAFSGDPRGCTVKLQMPDGETNDFGKEGWCVPGA